MYTDVRVQWVENYLNSVVTSLSRFRTCCKQIASSKHFAHHLGFNENGADWSYPQIFPLALVFLPLRNLVKWPLPIGEKRMKKEYSNDNSSKKKVEQQH